MARADYIAGMSIDEWGAAMGIDPYELNQVAYGFPSNSTNTQNAACEHAFYQYSYQQDFLSRQEIGDAIQRAEEMLCEELNFWPSPRYILNEEVQFMRPLERYLYGAGTDKRFQNKPVQLSVGYIQGFGTLVATDLGAQTVSYTDSNNDGVLDKFSISFSTTITDPTQLAVYFTPTDRDNAPIDDTWRLRPVKVSISSGTATITGHRALCVKPDLQSAYGATILDVTVSSNFVTQLEAYSLVLDTSYTTSDPAQGQAEWEGYMSSGLFVDPVSAITPGQVEVWPVALGLRNAQMGLVSVDYLLNGQNQPSQWREPDRVVVNYVAGYPRQADGRMDRGMADIVARLATSILPIEKCGCERSARIIQYWRRYPNDGFDTRNISQNEVDSNPFGQNMGALYAWRRVQQLKIYQAAVLT